MFDGFKVYSLNKKTVISFYPRVKLIFIFKESNGQLHAERISNGKHSNKINILDMPIIELHTTKEFLWLRELANDKTIEQISKFKSHQISMLNLTISIKEFDELFQSAPVLAWLLLSHLRRTNELKNALNLSILKRRKILSFITGVDCSSKHVKFINKIRIYQGNEFEEMLICHALQHEDIIDSFLHEQSVPIESLFLIYKYPILINSKILPSINKLPENEKYLSRLILGKRRITQNYVDTIEIGKMLGFKESKKIVACCSSVSALNMLHDQWTELLNNLNTTTQSNIRLPILNGTDSDNIQQIKTSHEVIKEGKSMNHCAASYIPRLIKQECYLFKVLYPERATLEIGLVGSKIFNRQLKLSNNREPSSDTQKYVKEWIEQVNKSSAFSEKIS